MPLIVPAASATADIGLSVAPFWRGSSLPP